MKSDDRAIGLLKYFVLLSKTIYTLFVPFSTVILSIFKRLSLVVNNATITSMMDLLYLTLTSTMNTLSRNLFIVTSLLAVGFNVHAQTDSVSKRGGLALNTFNSHSLNVLQKKYSLLQREVEKKTSTMLAHMQQKEATLQHRVANIDSVKAGQIFASSQREYQHLQDNLSEPGNYSLENAFRSYIPHIDSVRTSLRFLLLNSSGLSVGETQQLTSLSVQIQQLQATFAAASQAEVYVKQREQLLKDQLMRFGIRKQLLSVNKEVVYFQQQIADYKNTLGDKQKLEAAIIRTARSLPAFTSFWQKYSLLAQMFPLPANYGTDAALAGLQTNAAVTLAIQQSLGINRASAGVAAATPIPEQYLQQPQQQLARIKDKASQTGITSSDRSLPDFTPDQQHGKSLWQRLTYGFNMQTQAATRYLPAITDIGVQLGLKVSDQIQIGVGGSYKVGTGTLKCMHLSNEGVSARSYVDIRAKGSIWITGAWEDNYMPSFRSLQELHRDVSIWQKSALLGLTKKYTVGKREGNMQLLYDFMAGQVLPKSSPVKFRVGYSF